MDSSWTSTTLIAALASSLQSQPERRALTVPPGRGREPFERDRGGLLDEIAQIAHGLDQLGLKAGERVLFLSENSPRWIAMDLALMGLGCPDVPRGVEAPAEEIQFLVRKVRARVAVVQQPKDVPRLQQDDDPLELVILLSGSREDVPELREALRLVEYDELRSSAPPAAEAREWFLGRVAERGPDEIATIVFTSGTTGQPKGVVLTQANLAGNLHQTLAVIDFLEEGGRFVSILPPWHMFERLVEYALLCLHFEVVYTDRRNFAADVRKQRPDVLGAVPRLWVMLMDGVLSKAREAPRAKRLLLHGALRIGAAFVKARRAWAGRLPRFGQERGARRLRALPGLCLWPLYRLARWKVLGKVSEALGLQRLRSGAAISGGGSLPEHVDLFLESIGVRILNGYGLTETSPLLAVRLPHRNVVGTVGPPIPQTDIEIRDQEKGTPLPPGSQGVVFARGPQVMQGYWEEPEATATVLDTRGWFNTGDLGRMTLSGELQITGRAKDTIVLLSGENIEPEPLENALTESPLISQAVVVGQDQKFLAALIVPNREHEVTKELRADRLTEFLRREISEHVSSRRGFRAHERIVRFHVLEEPFSREDGSMSQTMKLKRNVIQDRHATDIRSLFEDPKA